MSDIQLFDSPKIDLLWPLWLDKFDELTTSDASGIAPPFTSAADSRLSNYSRRFMLVGQATKGECDFSRFMDARAVNASLEDRKHFNRELVTSHTKSSPFWQAFLLGSRLCGECDDYSNSVWSNIGKIGFSEKNIDYDLMASQIDLAASTLAAELDEYQPTLVHFVTGQIGDVAILKGTRTTSQDWTRLNEDVSHPENNIWSLGRPEVKMLWTRHPNRAKSSFRNAWEKKLADLAGL